jgi:hypothetical protein
VIAVLLALIVASGVSRTTTVSQGATIRGRVTDRDTGQPLPRFRVSVSRQPVLDENSQTLSTALSDSNGRYELTGVPPGAYVLTARPPQFVSTHLAQAYGHDEPLLMAGAQRIRTIELKPNDALEADFTIRRSLAIEGRIATADGDPLAGVLVSLERLERGVARKRLETDDRGFFRHFGLPPGRYRLCVEPAPPVKDPRPLAAQPTVRENLLITCYPAESDPAQAKAIELTAADARNVDIVMRGGRRFTISGELHDSAGGPLDAGDVSFVEENARPRRSLRVQRMRPGRFVVNDVEPGTYALRVEVAADGTTGRPRESAALELVVENDNIGGIVVRTRRPATVAGLVTFEGGAPEAGLDRMLVKVQRDVDSTVRPVRENLTFELAGTPDPVRLGLSDFPSGWIVKSILYHGRDVSDEAVVLDSSDDPRAIEIVLTNRVAYVAGNVAGVAKGRMVVILAFRAEKMGLAARPDASGGSSLPVAASAPADEKSAFKIGPLAPGDYFVAAVDRDEWFDASLENRSAAIDKVLPRAERVVLREGEQRSVALGLVVVK